MNKIKCPKCGEYNEVQSKKCYYCETKLGGNPKETVKVEPKNRENIFKFFNFVFWTVVVIGGIWFILLAVDQYDKNKEEELDKKLDRVCGTILTQQPNNTNLYDNCMDEGYSEFSTGE